GGGIARQAADRLRRAVPHALVPGDRRGGDDVTRAGGRGEGARAVFAARLAERMPSRIGEADHPGAGALTARDLAVAPIPSPPKGGGGQRVRGGAGSRRRA